MKKKGFTLVEIIISLVLIILIGTISIINFKKNENKTEEKLKKEIKNAVQVIESKLASSGNLNSFTDTDSGHIDNDVTEFYCLKKETLINEGILDENNEIIKNMSNNEYLYIEKDNVGSYKIDYSVSKEKCKYYIANIKSILGDETGEFTGGEENDSYAIKESFNEIEDNKYQMKLKFTKEVYSEEISPLYVIFVLDTSGSMSWNDSSGLAKTSIKKFGEDILNNIVNSRIGFLPFANYASPKKFGNSYWTNDVTTFKNSVNSVIYTGSNYYNKAYNSIINDYIKNSNDKLEDNATVYVVMFSDAGDGPSCYTTENKNLVVNNIAPLVDRIIFIAYNPGNVYCLSNISASVNNKYPDLSTHLFSNNSDVDKVLENVSNTVKEETQYKNVKISVQVDEEYFSILVDDTWNLNTDTNTISKEIDFSTLEVDILETELSFDIVYKAKTNVNSYTEEISIIKKFALEFEKKDGTKEYIELDSSKLPFSKIETTEKYVLN